MTPIVRGRPASIHSTQGRFAKALTIYTFNVNCESQQSKDTHTQTKTNPKCFRDPMYAIFKSRGFKDSKYDIGCLLVMTKTRTKTKTQFYALLVFFRGEYFMGVNIFEVEYFSGVNTFQE